MQRNKVHLGVDRRRVGTLVPQQFTNFIQGTSLPEQVAGQRVTKQMRALACRLHACSFESPHDDQADCHGTGEPA
jgi:hypothetical protein